MDTKAETRRAEAAGAGGKEAPALMDAINIRSTALLILTSIAALYFIDWAQPILLPLVVSVLISYALDPLVSLLDAIRVPRPVGAAVVLVAMIGVLAGASVPLQQEATAILDKVPAAVQKLRHDGDARDSEEGMMEKAQKAAKQIEETASQQSARTANVPAGVTPVQIINKPLDIQAYLLQGSPAALVLITQCFSVLLLVYFLLAVGSLYKRKVVRISGPSFGRMRKATRIMNEFHHQVRRFLFVMLLGAIFVGVLTWLAFLMIGMEQAAFWGVLAGVASAIPYLGPFLVLIGCSIAAFIQFGGMDMAVIVGGTSLIITSIQGYLLTPWLTSQVSSLNAVAIFIGLLVWGWLWGPVGLIIATPLLMIVKTLCDHVINLRPFGELLGK